MRYRHSNVPSLLQGDVPESEQRCFICGQSPCDFHHLLANSKKRFAEKSGAWIWLCRYHHRYIHDTKDGQLLWKRWKAEAQRQYEADHAHSEWMKGSHKSYI